MRKRTRIRALLTTAAVGTGILLGTAAPAQAADTEGKCTGGWAYAGDYHNLAWAYFATASSSDDNAEWSYISLAAPFYQQGKLVGATHIIFPPTPAATLSVKCAVGKTFFVQNL
ncbi:hypothetical protein QOM21_33720 [Streptomyces sp. Pv4-95]|uniref:hypothetical protein n=1 Tax=Streptomyces sp. Pv4-95 TaxID=3049543 RepID=UPI0038915193